MSEGKETKYWPNARLRICVTGAGGFIASHLAARLKKEGHYIVACDWKRNEYMSTDDFCDEFHYVDLRNLGSCMRVTRECDHVFHLAADMGGMGFIQNNHASILYNNTVMSFSMLEACRNNGVARYFFASSACIYPEHLQSDSRSAAVRAGLRESDAWPAAPQDAYGLEKLVTEELCRHYKQTYGIETRVGRYHNVYGANGSWKGGREKAPAALCRKIAAGMLLYEGESRIDRFPIEIWGDGEQTRSFMYIDDCVEGTLRLMTSNHADPVNIGTTDMVSLNELVGIIAGIAGVPPSAIQMHSVPGPEGVRGRNSDNSKIIELLGWEPATPLETGLRVLYPWVAGEISAELAKNKRLDLAEYCKSMQYVAMT